MERQHGATVIVTCSYAAQVMVHAGPWHARLLALGTEHMRTVEDSFKEDQNLSQPVVHHPRARLVVLQRNSARL